MERGVGLKKFIRYINMRCALIECGFLDVETNQYRYYKELQREIKIFAKSHRLFWNFLLGRISTEKAKSILGVSERQMFRTMEKQRETLITLIYEKEKELSAKYPFDGTAVWSSDIRIKE